MQKIGEQEMIDSLLELQQSRSWDEVKLEFGKYLGLDGAAPEGVTKRAIEDRMFAHYLVVCRGRLSYLNKLMEDPKNKEYENNSKSYVSSDSLLNDNHSNLELASTASKALFNWAKAGFSRTEPVEFDKRFTACNNCEFLVEPPSKLLYKFKLKNETDMRICNKCGCVASRKARLQSEVCPESDINNPGFNRWGQEISTIQ